MTRIKEPPSIRLQTPAGTAEVLRAHLAKHNRHVLLLAAGSLVAALAAWVLLYFVCLWFILLAGVISDPPREHTPEGFWLLYVTGALCAIGYAWVDQRLNPNARPRDKKGVGEIAMEFLLAIPRMTLAAGNTLRAHQRLSDPELLQAAELLHRLGDEKRVPMSGMRLQIPDPKSAMRILFALQMTEVIDTRREGNEFWLRLNTQRPGSLRMAREG